MSRDIAIRCPFCKRRRAVVHDYVRNVRAPSGRVMRRERAFRVKCKHPSCYAMGPRKTSENGAVRAWSKWAEPATGGAK